MIRLNAACCQGRRFLAVRVWIDVRAYIDCCMVASGLQDWVEFRGSTPMSRKSSKENASPCERGRWCT
jgi:hypothetical protein